MSKVLVDRELLEQIVNTNMGDYALIALQHKELLAILAQPTEAEGVSNARLMNTLAELARRTPLRTLHTICETQRQVSTVKLERYLGPVGNTLADYAFTLRIDFDKLSAALSAVTAERDRLREEVAELWKRIDKFQSQSHGIIALAEIERLRKDAERESAAFNAVIGYMLGKGFTEEPMEFLRCWNGGDFDSLREEWPEAPQEIYYADPLADHEAIDAATARECCTR